MEQSQKSAPKSARFLEFKTLFFDQIFDTLSNLRFA